MCWPYISLILPVTNMIYKSSSRYLKSDNNQTNNDEVILCGMVIAWWRHQMETFSALLAFYAGNSPVPGEFPTQRPVTRSFDVTFDLRPNKPLSK